MAQIDMIKECYQLNLILTALLHVDLINVAYSRHVPLSGPDDVALFE